MKIEDTDKIRDRDRNDIVQGLLKYNLTRIEDKNIEELGVYIRDTTGHVVAGLIGSVHGLWMTVKYLWISEELRGQGVGSQILSKAEEIAKEHGCKYVFLDTFDFQAPEFYKKRGYIEAFTLENYPITGKHYYFTKVL